jgi:hypothetical protein
VLAGVNTGNRRTRMRHSAGEEALSFSNLSMQLYYTPARVQPGSTGLWKLADALPHIGRATATMRLVIADATPTAATNEIACGNIGQSGGR